MVQFGAGTGKKVVVEGRLKYILLIYGYTKVEATVITEIMTGDGSIMITSVVVMLKDGLIILVCVVVIVMYVELPESTARGIPSHSL